MKQGRAMRWLHDCGAGPHCAAVLLFSECGFHLLGRGGSCGCHMMSTFSVSRRWEKGGDALIPIKSMLWNLPPSHFPSHPVGQNLINSHIRFREMPYTLLKLLKLNQNGSIETGGKRRNLCHPLLYSCADSMNYTCIALKTLEIP